MIRIAVLLESVPSSFVATQCTVVRFIASLAMNIKTLSTSPLFSSVLMVGEISGTHVTLGEGLPDALQLNSTSSPSTAIISSGSRMMDGAAVEWKRRVSDGYIKTNLALIDLKFK